jgi:hypothetical protein
MASEANALSAELRGRHLEPTGSTFFASATDVQRVRTGDLYRPSEAVLSISFDATPTRKVLL